MFSWCLSMKKLNGIKLYVKATWSHVATYKASASQMDKIGRVSLQEAGGPQAIHTITKVACQSQNALFQPQEAVTIIRRKTSEEIDTMALGSLQRNCGITPFIHISALGREKFSKSPRGTTGRGSFVIDDLR